MSDLGLDQLTDDQLLQLLRELLAEISTRNPAVKYAARHAGLDEVERMSIAKEAAEKEAAIMRAKERERVAKEAAERVRMEREAETAIATRRAAREAAERAAKAIIEKETSDKEWLEKAAALLSMAPQNITILRAPGKRVIINEGADRYARDHLVDWSAETGSIKTKKAHMGAKIALAALCAEWYDTVFKPNEYIAIIGAEYTW